ncbi:MULTISPECIES: hypothetical protein [unclassified Microcystis]|jgi:hypothetical protein|uniref:hypothetical protein n=1 Tax=unclassified Microcystis TaxID=2643300 RepID=UPI0022C9A6AE|nr:MULTISPECIES: hypothetical protein [unclassified Microcystis]MCA2691534.1 hypothetical protein [Microcystis sp. M034S2]MCA2751892.1 hypothetical protein [Microcystis sp. M144S2]MCZ8201381.1 hypothetical protein [Microcystis sp. LE19-55.1A]MCZ8305676.1 hypothetical protein [Microcystis sp. LE19-98.1E]
MKLATGWIMPIIYEFSNSSYWEFVGQQTLTAPVNSEEGIETFSPIGDTGFPIALESPIIAVSATAFEEQQNWNYAGKVFQRIFTGITIGGSFDSYVDSQSVFFKKVNVIRFNQLNSSYALTFRPPRWVTSVTYRVFIYTGPIVDTIDEKLDQILNRLPGVP